MIQNVWIGGDKLDTTPMTHFKGMNSVLDRLGFVAAKGLHHKFAVTHFNRYHVDLRAPVRVSLPNNLEAASTAPENDAPTVALADLPASYQELLVAAQTELQPESGALNMFVDLPPDSPNAAPIMMVAQAKQAQKPSAAMRTVGVCTPMANLPDDPAFGSQTIAFEAVAVNYLAKYEKVNLATQTAKVTVLQLPAHGQLTGGDTYKPARGFFGGQDQVSALVELGGYQVKVIYFIKVQPEGTGGIPDDEDLIKELCGPKGGMWREKKGPGSN